MLENGKSPVHMAESRSWHCYGRGVLFDSLGVTLLSGLPFLNWKGLE